MNDPVATSRREYDLLRELAELARAERGDESDDRERGTDASAADPPKQEELA